MDVKSLVADHEGLKLKPYKCTAGKLTIGYGRNLEDRGITREEADYLLQNDIELATAQCQHEFDFFDRLGEVRQAVLIDMCVNLGIAGLSKFVRTISLIKQGQYEMASDGMLQSLWAKQVGQRAVELATMMRTGKWP